MKKTKKRLLSLVLACAAALGTAAATPLQAGALHIQSGTAGVAAYTSTVVFAGHTWAVVGCDGAGTASTANTATLLHAKGCCTTFTATPYDTAGYNPYANSTLHGVMTDIGAGMQAASALEYALIAPRPLDGVNAPGQAGEDGSATLDTPQAVWPLSLAESQTISDAAPGLLAYNDTPGDTAWWLRSPGADKTGTTAAAVYAGTVAPTGDNVQNPWGVRPALRLSLADVLFTAAATGGKPGTAGQWAAAEAPGQTEALKFTVRDAGLALADATATSVAGGTIQFSYNATAGAGSAYNRLSAMVTDSSGALKQYCTLDNNPGAAASVTVPDGLAATDLLFVFVENAAPDSDRRTDFASAPVRLGRAAPTGLAATAPSHYHGSDGTITGTTAEMEYSTDGISWTDAAGAEVAGLATGIYQVRYKAQTVNGITAILASPAATVAVGEGVPLPTISGPASLKLAEGYKAASTGAFAVTGHPLPAVTLEDDTSGNKITWNNTTRKLDIAEGLAAGSYSATLKAANSAGSASLTFTLTVTDGTASPGQNTITAPATAPVGQTFTITAHGGHQDAVGSVVGELRYVPVSWSINPSGEFPPGGPYTASITLTAPGPHTLTVTYQLQRWDGSAWQDVPGSTDTKTAVITVQAGSSPHTATGGSPQTADSQSMGVWVFPLMLSLAGAAVCLVWRRREKKANTATGK